MGIHSQGRKPLQVMTAHIKNGRVIDPRNRVDAKQDVFMADGKIAALGKAPAGFRAERAIAADGLVVCPGLIDLSARLREPGFEYKATLASEMQAAVAGGITSLACPPDTDPPLDEPGLVEMLKHRAKSLNLVHVYPVGALTWKLGGERLTGMVGLRDARCLAFSHAHTAIRVTPPSRSVLDRRALRWGRADGTIDALCSDHAPVDEDAKQLPFAESEPGVTGLELLLPLTLKWAEEMRVALPEALATVTSKPAAILGMPAGGLAVRRDADLCVVDPNAHVKITADSLKSQGKNTPFIAYELPGRVRYTLIGGQVVYQA